MHQRSTVSLLFMLRSTEIDHCSREKIALLLASFYELFALDALDQFPMKRYVFHTGMPIKECRAFLVWKEHFASCRTKIALTHLPFTIYPSLFCSFNALLHSISFILSISLSVSHLLDFLCGGNATHF